MIKPEDLFKSSNALAEYYSEFKVSNRLLFTGHSHQAWPDCGFEGHKQTWLDAAEFVDEKWEKAFEKAQKVQDGYLKLLDDDSGYISLSSNTHELLVRFLSALPLKKKNKIITTDGEFHTVRRQMDRLAEEGIEIIKVSSSEPEKVPELLSNELDDKTAAVIVSKVFFQTAQIVPDLSELLINCKKFESELLIDVYHALNVVPFSVKKENIENAFIIGGGYKYCQLGEGNCFLRFPKDCRMRPVITGWYSEFGELAEKKSSTEVSYGKGSFLFSGATYDPTSNYRAAEVFKFFEENKLTPDFLREVSQHQITLLAELFDKLDLDTSIIKRLSFPIESTGGFFVLKSKVADKICNELKNQNVLTDFRGNYLRFGPAPYISDDQIKEAIDILGKTVKKLSE